MTVASQPEPLLDVRRLSIDFQTETGLVRAVDEISFAVHQGEIVGLVGESGAGKSLTSEAILRLIRCPPGILSGEIRYRGVDLLSLRDAELAKMRGKEIAMIFQNPLSSLNPVFRIGAQLLEAMTLHLSEATAQLRARVIDLLQRVGIPSAQERAKDYPHQFSGGMSQRAMIGMGISCAPSLLIADEPTTALDVTIQAQILSLIRRLATETNTAILLVSHDLGIISQMCSRVMVMYAGKIVEEAPISTIFHAPAHPYTRGLMESIPQIDRPAAQLYPIPGTMPGLRDIPRGCRFHPRCALSDQTCVEVEPELRQLSDEHWTACHKALPGGVHPDA
ncbi:MAG: peptide ABC transporter ATP-binding protein [Candidatus Entotheonella factor]|uniref:Peptide ABC transporter ATP-binding protein n=1 Tax=Entotheonella factor TaxID=1429438 RepID=W4LA46_ENTF1|nr:MAG: peptide ABC transporter ATP-binding protein [Candidatus Entotheonella factor]